MKLLKRSVLLLLSFSLSGCGKMMDKDQLNTLNQIKDSAVDIYMEATEQKDSNDDRNPNEISKNIAANVMECLKNKDEDGLYRLFNGDTQLSPYLAERVADRINQIDGEIVSYDEPDNYMSEKTKENGELAYSQYDIGVHNVKTDKGTLYTIRMSIIPIHQNHMFEGLTSLMLLNETKGETWDKYENEKKIDHIWSFQKSWQGDAVDELLLSLSDCITGRKNDKLRDLMSEQVKKTPDLVSRLTKQLNNIEGNVISCDEPCWEEISHTEEDGKVTLREYKGVIKNIKTDTGNAYTANAIITSTFDYSSVEGESKAYAFLESLYVYKSTACD